MAATPQSPGSVHGGRLSYAIFALARAHRGVAAGMLRDLGLHPGQELLLMQLFDQDGQTQSELLDSVGLDHSTVSKSLRRMQEAGLVTRRPNEHDRRVLNVWLTERGRELRRPIETMWAALEEISTRHLDEQAIRSFTATAATIESSITNRTRPAPESRHRGHRST
ncbi:MarR family winged helix-turn-helix transcriptional regulator [Streptosporangium sp. 'caverna']|uniref:MarR family winged helix-turn-helix transcriptional regulator n=1 Tax=Streptosporangium sp. 'caverna' TaxID=2202249 RepID=UPI000D7E614B|nr:MarR family winged helix-turn-helix transcriptional regulator [Streptosporangium sp. 'caverna']AWS44915.1 transcriptional regulator [Streptosporangium sp. 'caverna']